MRRVPQFALIGMCAVGSASAAPVPPTPLVWYNVSLYTSAEVGECDTVGETYAGEFLFAGAGKTGSQLLLETPNSSGPGNPDIVVLDLPAMPAKDKGTSSGRFTGIDLKESRQISGTFKITLSWGTANAFLATVTIAPSTACNFTAGLTAIHSGK
jgi:hypothetical protein